jgi:hypothetical protein
VGKSTIQVNGKTVREFENPIVTKAEFEAFLNTDSTTMPVVVFPTAEIMDPIEAIFADAGDRRDAEELAAIIAGCPTEEELQAEKDLAAKIQKEQKKKPMWSKQINTIIGDELKKSDRVVAAAKAVNTLKVHRPEPAPKRTFGTYHDIVYDEDLIAKMMANMASHSMTLEDLAGHSISRPPSGHYHIDHRVTVSARKPLATPARIEP